VLRSSIITCDGLPISSGGAHGLRTRSQKVALKHVRDFLRDRTDNSIPSDVFVEVIHSRGFRKEFTIPLVERLATKLGTPIRRHAGAEDIAHRWKLTADQIDEHVELIEQACPLPRHPFKIQPFVVAGLFKFRLVSQGTKLPSQDVACMEIFRLAPASRWVEHPSIQWFHCSSIFHLKTRPKAF
jgi:hypothetical protein